MIRILLIVCCTISFNIQSQSYNLNVEGEVVNLGCVFDSLSKHAPSILDKRIAVDFILKNEVRKKFIKDFFDSDFLENLPEDSLISYDEAYSLAKRELIFVGRIIEKKNLSDNRCTYFKTQYKVLIDELVFSFYPYSAGDTIFLNTIAGKVGKCDSTLPQLHLGVSGSPKYEIGESKLFALSNVTYYASLITNKDFGANRMYQDSIDPHFFLDYNSGIHLNSKGKVLAIRKYMNKIYKSYKDE